MRKRKEGKQASPCTAPEALIILIVKYKDKYNCLHFIHEKVKFSLPHMFFSLSSKSTLFHLVAIHPCPVMLL